MSESGSILEQKQTPAFGHLVRVDVKLLRQFRQRLVLFERIKGFAGAGVGDQRSDPAESQPKGAKGGRQGVALYLLQYYR